DGSRKRNRFHRLLIKDLYFTGDRPQGLDCELNACRPGREHVDGLRRKVAELIPCGVRRSYGGNGVCSRTQPYEGKLTVVASLGLAHASILLELHGNAGNTSAGIVLEIAEDLAFGEVDAKVHGGVDVGGGGWIGGVENRLVTLVARFYTVDAIGHVME